MNNTSLHLDNVTKTYRSGSDDVHVLKGVSISVPAGESIAVVGTSGCGKSTLLNLIGGLDGADGGRISACGYEVTRLTEAKLTAYRSSAVGFIFQFHYLLKDFTALENVMLPMVMAGAARKTAEQSAKKLLEQVRLADRGTHYPAQLSGGERQRVALARALINSPGLILADEPTGNLDEKHKQLVADLLFSLTAESGKILVLVTHAPDLAERADRSCRLSDGRLVTA